MVVVELIVFLVATAATFFLLTIFYARFIFTASFPVFVNLLLIRFVLTCPFLSQTINLSALRKK